MQDKILLHKRRAIETAHEAKKYFGACSYPQQSEFSNQPAYRA